VHQLFSTFAIVCAVLVAPSQSCNAENLDPFSLLLDRAVEAMDESYDGWNHRPEQTVDSTTFTTNYTASISIDGRRRLDRVLLLHADPDLDQEVTREEVLRFLEIQLGIRWVTGDRLREADGRVVDFAKFIAADVDQNDVLSKNEFLETWWESAVADRDFFRLDADDNEIVTLAEFSLPGGPNIVDPIELFRSADANRDSLLDEDELNVATPTHRSHLVQSNLSAFDNDHDGMMSLAEFQVSMLGNFNYPWETIPKDEDQDQQLSFDEFKFHRRDLFQLQRRYYFHRLDLDGDGRLTPDEFEFQPYKLHSIFRVSVDGKDVQELYQHEDFPVCGSPAVSPDGGWILFDATPPAGANKSQILLMKSDGTDVRDLCDGLMPSWSSDGSQFACSRYEGGTGVWIMNLDGTAEKRLDDGWAAQWSPNGEFIAYTNDNSIRLYDVASGSSRAIMAKGTHPYHYIFWNMAWSPDSRQLVFRGKLEGKCEIAILNVMGEQNLNRRFASSEDMGQDFAWSPDGRRILFDMHSRQHLHGVIYQLDPLSKDPPEVVPDAPTTLPWSNISLSPRGEWMVLVTPN